MTGIVTASWISTILSGSAMRATPPSARMSAGTRSSAITATAPASSAMRACSASVTSMITPPLSISARPPFTRIVPISAIAAIVVTAEAERFGGLAGQRREPASLPTASGGRDRRCDLQKQARIADSCAACAEVQPQSFVAAFPYRIKDEPHGGAGCPNAPSPVSGFVPITSGMTLGLMTPIRVLLVDDDEDFAESLAAALSPSTAESRSSPPRATASRPSARCAEIRPDVVAMDIHMPAMDGVEATRRICAEDYAAGRDPDQRLDVHRCARPRGRGGRGRLPDQGPVRTRAAARRARGGSGPQRPYGVRQR